VAEITVRPKIEVTVTFQISEAEARALDALVCYGDDAFIKYFYQFLGRHYMEPHEAGLRSLFKSVRDFMPGILSRTNKAREAFTK